MDNLGQEPTSTIGRPTLWSRRPFRVALGVALVLGVGGASYGIAAAVSDGGSTAGASSPNSSVPPNSSTAPGPGRPGPFAPGAPGVSGTVRSVGANSFVLSTPDGTVTVDVGASTRFVDGQVADPSFSDVTSGVQATAIGTRTGSTIDASRVILGGRGGRFGRGQRRIPRWSPDGGDGHLGGVELVRAEDVSGLERDGEGERLDDLSRAGNGIGVA